MIAVIREWFSARTPREQMLLQFAVLLVLGGGGAAWAYQAAGSFRAAAASDLASATVLRADVGRLTTVLAAAPAAPAPTSDGSPRGIAAAAAAQLGLQLTHIEPAGPTGTRASFAAAPAASLFIWVDAVEHAGLEVSRISLVRAGEGDVVAAEVVFGGRGS